MLALLVATASAEAAFPGQNGRIAYAAYLYPHDIYTIDPSGVTELNISRDPGDSVSPAFSPDGTKLAYVSGPDRARMVFVSGVHGQDPQVVLDPPTGVTAVAWSPTGDQMIAAIGECDAQNNCPNDLWVFNADGTGLHKVVATPTRHEENASWSPDGTTIAFTSVDVPTEERDVWVMSPDGSNQENRTGFTSAAAHNPDWSPDGERIVFTISTTLHTMNPDGTDVQPLAPGIDPVWSPDGLSFAIGSSSSLYVRAPDGQQRWIATGQQPDWQAVQSPPTPPSAVAGYPRPKGADAMDVYLVPAYLQCTPSRADRQHGPPLAYPSCPPRLRNTFLTVGTPDANGQPAKAIGRLRLATVRGDPSTTADEADVTVQASQSDVRRENSPTTSGYPDYEGELHVKVTLRVTDRFNAGGPEASGTVMDYPLKVAMPCAATADTTIGGSCGVTTSVEAMTPGAVDEGNRAIWQAGEVRVYFPGNPSYERDDQLFLTQGIFVP